MTEEEILRMALAYWNEDKDPPEEYAHAVGEYIKNHPEDFRGAVA